MRKLLTLLSITAVLCLGCGPQKAKHSGYSEYEQPDTASKVQRMSDYRYSADITDGDTRYSYVITRKANDSVPLIKGEGNELYADNYVKLVIKKNGNDFFNKTFTKNSFRNFMDRKFHANAVLEGMAFDRIVPEGLRFASSVSYPATDMFLPFFIIVSRNGSVQIIKDESLDMIAGEDSI